MKYILLNDRTYTRHDIEHYRITYRHYQGIQKWHVQAELDDGTCKDLFGPIADKDTAIRRLRVWLVALDAADGDVLLIPTNLRDEM